MGKIKVPRDLRPRLRAAADEHGYGSADELALRLVERGLEKHGLDGSAGKLKNRLKQAAEEQGYSSVDELTVHLLEKGLKAYERPGEDPAELEKRLRGLGYIE